MPSKNNSSSKNSRKPTSPRVIRDTAANLASTSEAQAVPALKAEPEIKLPTSSNVTPHVVYLDSTGGQHSSHDDAVFANTKALLFNRLTSYLKVRGQRLESESIAQLFFGVDSVDDLTRIDDIIELRLILDDALAHHDRELELKPTHISAT